MCSSSQLKMNHLWFGARDSQDDLEKCGMLLHLSCWICCIVDINSCVDINSYLAFQRASDLLDCIFEKDY